MKPACHSISGRNRFPQTDYFFHSGFAGWRGYSPSDDWENRREFRNFYNLGREFRIEAARERAKEMAVFALIVLTSAFQPMKTRRTYVWQGCAHREFVAQETIRLNNVSQGSR